MRLINVYCDDSESFKYPILLYLYYYNIKKNHARVTQLNNNLNSYIAIKFNKNSDILQFEKDNPLIDVLIIDINTDPIFLARNNANIKATIVNLNDYRYSLFKPSMECFRDNISKINRINRDKCEKYNLTDEIKKDLCLHLQTLEKCG